MAYVKSISIKQSSHMGNALNYIANPEKTQYIDNALDYIKNPQKTNLVFNQNCFGSNYEIAKQFQQVRKSFNKDNNILAHHLVQSFSPNDNVTPEQAFTIAKRLIEKIAPNYQVTISTHIDKDHIHNHIIINAVNPVTGKKWVGNQSTLDNIRAESDKLCKEFELSVIENTKGYKGIDNATYQLAKKGKSWKVQLVKDLKEALSICKSKKEFVKFLNEKDYKVKWNNKNIVIQKVGEEKSIRVDTLARQFGVEYTKENIEKTLNCFVKIEDDISSPTTINQDMSSSQVTTDIEKEKNISTDDIEVAESEDIKTNYDELIKKKFPTERKNVKVVQLSEWEKFEKHHFENKTDYIEFPKWTVDKNLFLKNPFKFTCDLVRYIFIKDKNKKVGNYKNKKEIKKHSKLKNDCTKKEDFSNISNSSNNYKVLKNTQDKSDKGIVTIGNCSYSSLKSSQGSTATVTVYIHQIPLIYNSDFFFFSHIDYKTGTAKVTLKENNLTNLAKCLNLSDKDFFIKQNEIIKNKKAYKNIKSKAEDKKDKVEYLIVTKEQCTKLDEYFIPYAKFPKGDKINIAFNSSNKIKIKSLIYPKKDYEEQKNLGKYRSLKTKSALNKDRLMFKLLTADEISNFEKSVSKDLLYSKFAKGENTNLVYLKSDEREVIDCIYKSTEKEEQQQEVKNNQTFRL